VGEPLPLGKGTLRTVNPLVSNFFEEGLPMTEFYGNSGRNPKYREAVKLHDIGDSFESDTSGGTREFHLACTRIPLGSPIVYYWGFKPILLPSF